MSCFIPIPSFIAILLIRSIPTLLVFKNGEKVGQIVGAKPKAALLKEIEAFK
jgi:thioredoxin 1